MPIIVHLIEEHVGFLVSSKKRNARAWFYYSKDQGHAILDAHIHDKAIELNRDILDESHLPTTSISDAQVVIGEHAHTLKRMVSNLFQFQVNGTPAVLPTPPGLSAMICNERAPALDGFFLAWSNPNGRHYLCVCYSQDQLHNVLKNVVQLPVSQKRELSQLGRSMLSERSNRTMVIITDDFAERVNRVHQTVRLLTRTAPN